MVCPSYIITLLYNKNPYKSLHPTTYKVPTRETLTHISRQTIIKEQCQEHNS
jgi:hypothetical protein